MKIADIMTKNPYVLLPGNSIAEAAKLFLAHDIDAAPVVDNDKLIGLIDKVQLYEALAYNTALATIDEVMITNVATCHPDDDIATFLEAQYSHLPVVEKGMLLGMVTQAEVLKYFNIERKDLINDRYLKEHLDAIFEASFDYLFVTDTEGRVTKVNQAYYRITGIRPEEVLGKTMYELVAQGFYDRSCSVEVIETLKPVTFVQKIKTGRTVLVTGNPVFDEKGHLMSVITNGRDITELNELKEAVSHVTSLSQHYKNELNRIKGLTNCVAASPAMMKLIEKVSHLAQFDSAVLITGESGVGKEIIAHQIYLQSARRDNPYIRINCASIPENLLESELFGYVEGAFTGAKKGGKMGIFELANGGTLLLDEIGELPLSMQAKLLRVIQEKEVARIGGNKTVKIDVRIISSTNRDLNVMINNKEFRKDLYYRLNVVPVEVPALRERREDIPVLIDHFIDSFNKKYKLDKRIDPALIEKLVNYSWPGNVRELKNIIERAIVTSSDKVIREIILETDSSGKDYKVNYIDQSGVNLKQIVNEIEKHYIESYLERYGSTRKAAAALGMSQSTFCRKASIYNIKVNLN